MQSLKKLGQKVAEIGSVQTRTALFTIAVVALVSAAGSGLTVVLVLALFFNLILLASGALRLTIPPGQRLFVLAFTQFALVGFVMTFYHERSVLASAATNYILFLAPLILLPSYAIGPPRSQLRTILVRSMAIAGLLAGLLAGVETSVWGGRATAMAANSLILATIALMAGLGALVMVFEPPRKFDRFLAALGWAGALLAVILTQSRTPLVVFVACSTLYILLNWRTAAKLVSRKLLFVALTFAIIGSGLVTKLIIDRVVSEPRLVAADQPSSAQWRLVYLAAGWRVASDNFLVGVGRYERAIRVGAELGAMNQPTGIREEAQYTSWHRWIAEPLRQMVIDWQLSRWQAQVRIAEENGSDLVPDRPHIQKTTTTVVTSPHSHLHNANMTMLVDHGIIGVTSLLVLFFGPLVAGYRASIHRSDPVLFHAYLVMIAAVTLIGLTNVHVENDIIASYFIVLSIAYWASFRMPGSDRGAAQID